MPAVPTVLTYDARDFKEALNTARHEQLAQVHASLTKYIEVLPAYMVRVA